MSWTSFTGKPIHLMFGLHFAHVNLITSLPRMRTCGFQGFKWLKLWIVTPVWGVWQNWDYISSWNIGWLLSIDSIHICISSRIWLLICVRSFLDKLYIYIFIVNNVHIHIYIYSTPGCNLVYQHPHVFPGTWQKLGQRVPPRRYVAVPWHP